MTINLFQRLQVTALLLIVKVIYFIDVATGEIFEQAVKLGSYFAVISFSSASLALLVFSLQTGYLQQVSKGVYAAVTYDSTFGNGASSLVLGAKVTKKEFPILLNQNFIPEVSAKSVLIADKTNKKLLYEKNSNVRLASASTTKLMTALVALDVYSLDDLVTISKNCSEVDSTKAGLPEGTTYRVIDLLNAMLISSAGDSACALSEGKIRPDEFVFRMNQKAYKIDMQSSFFTNPIGLDGENSSHFSSAQDLYRLAVEAMNHNVIRQIVKTKEFAVKSFDEKFIGKIETTNKLLYEIPQTIGVKTGRTTEAGEVLIYEYKDDTKDLLIIVMGSEDRFTDVRALLNWLLTSYSWQ